MKFEKPYDIGNTIVSASVSETGKIITLNTAHKKHGFIKLAPVKSFSNSNWYNPEEVRLYRNSFLSDVTASKGYGLDFSNHGKNFPSAENDVTNLRFESNILYSEFVSNKFIFKKHIFTPIDENCVIQLYELQNLTEAQIRLEFKVAGYFGIIRASYGQITENGPIPIPPVKNHYKNLGENKFLITEIGTESLASIEVSGDYDQFHLIEEITAQDEPFTIANEGIIVVPPAKLISLALIIRISDEPALVSPSMSMPEIYKALQNTRDYWDKLRVYTGNHKWDFIINRNFAYSYGCCFIKKFGAMITDHQSLPLTWNRDNYFMYKLMESVYRITLNSEILEALKCHIKWLFTYITENGWGRSHLVNGKIKDKVFQFDQQCYPVLELYDYLRINPDSESEIRSFAPLLNKVSDVLFCAKGKGVMLFETKENPADDPVKYPYHFSTQILAWKTFKVLASLNARYAFSNRDFLSIAEEIKADILKYMITEDNDKSIFCYTTDLRGNYELYHDANDMPFALASLWGFVDVADSVYLNSFDWAFSERNRGYYLGEFGGLGSDHAKGHWPLGDSQVQAIATAMIKSNIAIGYKLLESIQSMLQSVVQKDGLFSESVHHDTGKVFTRYWFAWPGASISWFYMLNKFNKLQEEF